MFHRVASAPNRETRVLIPAVAAAVLPLLAVGCSSNESGVRTSASASPAAHVQPGARVALQVNQTQNALKLDAFDWSRVVYPETTAGVWASTWEKEKNAKKQKPGSNGDYRKRGYRVAITTRFQATDKISVPCRTGGDKFHLFEIPLEDPMLQFIFDGFKSSLIYMTGTMPAIAGDAFVAGSEGSSLVVGKFVEDIPNRKPVDEVRMTYLILPRSASSDESAVVVRLDRSAIQKVIEIPELKDSGGKVLYAKFSIDPAIQDGTTLDLRLGTGLAVETYRARQDACPVVVAVERFVVEEYLLPPDASSDPKDEKLIAPKPSLGREAAIARLQHDVMLLKVRENVP